MHLYLYNNECESTNSQKNHIHSHHVEYPSPQPASKSIKPVDRGDYEQSRNERKLTGLIRERQQFTGGFKDSQQCLNFIYGSSKQQSQRIEEEPVDSNQEENFKQIVRKMTSPSVVKVEFSNEFLAQRRKKLGRDSLPVGQALGEGDGDTLGPIQSQRFLYCTNTKTYDQFYKFWKVRPTKRDYNPKDETNQEWNKYLHRYYLSIKKVRPLLKRETAIRLLSPNKISDLQQKIKQNKEQDRETIQYFSRFKSNSSFQNKSTTGAHSESPQLISNISPPAKMYKKIEHDLVQKRPSPRKDYFVFGMGESASKTAEGAIKVKMDLYRDFIFKVNFTSGLYVKASDQAEHPLKVFVGFGNNSALIKGLMRRRHWWQLVDKITSDTNFAWTQLKLGDFFKMQKAGSMRLVQSKKSFRVNEGEFEGVQIEEKQRQRAIMNDEQFQIWEHHLYKFRKQQQKGFQSGLAKRCGMLRKKGVVLIQNSIKLKMHNHFECNYFLGNKKALFYSLRKYYRLLGKDPFAYIPTTFHISQGLQDPQFKQFLGEYERQADRRRVEKDFRNIWIVKPGQNTNRGKGITVCSTLDEIKIRLRGKQRNATGGNRTFIIQKYIQKPLLYQNRKFDIRHYLLVTCIGGRMRGYWYAEGYVRTTSSEYNVKNCKDLFTHLTNDAVQKYGQDYGKYEKGNKLSYADFHKYICKNIAQQADFQGIILRQMQQLATDAVRATYSILQPRRREYNFQLFGLDFMLDQNLTPFLIEVNTNPCLETSCPLLARLITQLIENLLKLCLDPLFPPPHQWPTTKKYHLGDDALQENRFSLIFDEAEEGEKLRKMYKDLTKLDEGMGDIQQEEQEYNDEEKQWNDDEEGKEGSKK